MTTYTPSPHRGKTPAEPFRTVGTLALGDHAALRVQVGVSGGATIVNLRNEMATGAATLPAGPGALFGADRIGDLIAILEQARASA